MTPAQTLLTWYKHHGRDLPWRLTRDAYHILISEIMLQQTQVPRVLLFYPRWFKTFPTWKSLTASTNADLLEAWAGLGYNRRAFMLRDIAKHVIEHGVPKDEEAWRKLKGIGAYTAAALSAFSAKQRTIPIDTNIRRVAGRLLLGFPFPDPTQDERLKNAISTFLPTRGKYYDVPQAFFDLATTVCQKTPLCKTCPMRKTCRAAPTFLKGDVETPKRLIKKAVEKRHQNKPHPDRIYRGRILKLIREEPDGVLEKTLGKKIDPTFEHKNDSTWLKAILTRMEKEGFLEKRGTRWILA
jgi:A/G-specific adenine glycosylase